MSLGILSLLGASLIGFIVGFLTGILGVGGGFIMTPALMIILGISGPVSVGTSLAAILANSIFGIIKRKGSATVDLKLAFVISSGSAAGVLLGSYTLEILKNVPKITVMGRPQETSQYILLCIFVVFLSWIAAYIYFDYKKNGHKSEEDHEGLFANLKFGPYMKFPSLVEEKVSVIPLILLGIFIGFLTGLLGIGGGVVVLPALIFLVGQKTVKAAGTSLAIVLIASLIGVVKKSFSGDINTFLLMALLVGGLIGTFIGTKTGLELTVSKIKLCFMSVVFVAILMIVSKIYILTFL